MNINYNGNMFTKSIILCDPKKVMWFLPKQIMWLQRQQIPPNYNYVVLSLISCKCEIFATVLSVFYKPHIIYYIELKKNILNFQFHWYCGQIFLEKWHFCSLQQTPLFLFYTFFFFLRYSACSQKRNSSLGGSPDREIHNLQNTCRKPSAYRRVTILTGLPFDTSPLNLSWLRNPSGLSRSCSNTHVSCFAAHIMQHVMFSGCFSLQYHLYSDPWVPFSSALAP